VRWLLLAFLAACGRIDFDPLDDVIFHFEFESGALLRDSSLHHHDASCVHCPTAAPGRVGAGAAAFDGSQCIHLPDANDLRPEAFTLAAWVSQSVAPPLFANLISRPFDGATSLNDTYDLYIDRNGAATAEYANQLTTAPTSSLGGWHHLAATYENHVLAVFVDGVNQNTRTFPVDLVYADDSDHIGCDVDSGTELYFVTGTIDDARMYGRVLSADEIASLAAM
jgi:hypothetical protein